MAVYGYHLCLYEREPVCMRTSDGACMLVSVVHALKCVRACARVRARAVTSFVVTTLYPSTSMKKFTGLSFWPPIFFSNPERTVGRV